ncbi:Berberine bridge enzyme-like 8 [Linum grandiflorum]
MDETTAFLSSLANNSDPAHPISAAVYTTDHPSYSSALNAYIHNLRFTTASTPKPFLILTASHISHVQAAVISAAAHPAVHMKIRSGGHDYEGTSYSSSSDRSPFFILDMCNLRNIDVDIRSETAWVECGATLGEFFHAIAEKSPTHAFPAGVCPTVGVGGHFVGGGYGNLMRKYGLSIDNIVDARMGEDLFWAIRGGGASFGVVLSYKVNLVRVPEVVTVFRVRRTLEENATEIVYTWQKAKTVRGTFIGMFLGRSERLLSIMRETFPELGLTTSDCVETSWINTVAFWADKPAVTKTRAEIKGLPNNLLHLKRKSDYVERPIPKDGLEKIWRKMMEVGVVKMGFNPYGGRMSEISPEATPFPHRAGNLWKIQYQTNWTEGGKEAERRHLELSREMYGFMTPYVSSCPRGAFFNYKDLDLGVINNNGGGYEEGKRYGLSYFKGNFDKLVRIKSEVDPGNLFRHEQSVPVLARRPKL